MKSGGKDAVFNGLVLGTGVLVLLTGCWGSRQAATGLRQPDLQQAQALEPAPAAVEETEIEDKADVVPDVAAFLERTQDYALHDPAKETGGAQSNSIDPSASPLNTDYMAKVIAPEKPSITVTAPPETKAASVLMPALPIVESLVIRLPDSIELMMRDPAPNTPTHSANTPLEVGSAEMPITPDRFLHHLQAQLPKPVDLDSEWRLRLVQLALGFDREASDVSADLPADARRLLDALVEVGIAVRGAARDPITPQDEALTRAENLRRLLADRADPIVSDMAMCRRVVDFGIYDELDGTTLIAGRSLPIIIYSQIDNLRAEPTHDGFFRTLLGSRIEVLSVDGKAVWQSGEQEEIADLCRRPRRDFFLAQRILLPPTLPAGDYVLKIRVEDKLSRRANEANMPFTIHTSLSIATGSGMTVGGGS